jgi:hypothetical protein
VHVQAVNDILPGGDLMHAFHWHLDVCIYILTMYGVYYVWLVPPCLCYTHAFACTA